MRSLTIILTAVVASSLLAGSSGSHMRLWTTPSIGSPAALAAATDLPSYVRPHRLLAGVPGKVIAFRAFSADGHHAFFEMSTGIYDRVGSTITRINPEETYATFLGAAPDGSSVYFRTNASLVPEDTNNTDDIYQRYGSTISLISGPRADVWPPSIGNFEAGSDDGSRAVFSTAERLVPDDTDDAIDLYLHDAAGLQLISGASPVVVLFAGASSDLHRILFYSSVPVLPGDPTGPGGVFEWRDGQLSRRLGSSEIVGVSRDASRIAFNSVDGLVPDDTDDYVDLYLDVEGTPILLTPGAVRSQAKLEAMTPDASRVFYTSEAPQLPADADVYDDIYRWSDGGLELVTGGTQDYTRFGGIDAAGAIVYLISPEGLVAADTNATADIYRYDVGDPTPKLITPGDRPNARLIIGVSSDGSKIVFDSNERLLPGDTDDSIDYYEIDLAKADTPICLITDGLPGVTSSSTAKLSVVDPFLPIHYAPATDRLEFPTLNDAYISDPDGTEPLVTSVGNDVLKAGPTTGSPLSSRIVWSARDTATGIRSSDVEKSVDGGPWSPAATAGGAHLDLDLSAGHRYRFRVRATDGALNTSGWTYGKTFRMLGYQQTTSRFRYTGRWRTLRLGAAWGGSFAQSTTPGSTVRFSFKGRSLSWIAGVGPTRGSARVYINGVLVKTVSLHRASHTSRIVVFRKSWTTSATRTVVIRVVGTRGHPRVDFDGIVVTD